MRVFLIHGLGRTPASMWLLARRLRQAGHAVTTFGYLASREPLASIAQRFAERIRQDVEDGEPYAVVGHSLGNIITRLAGPSLPSGFARFVMLAPPNRPPVMARMLRQPLLRIAAGDAGRKLNDETFYASLPTPSVPALIIAGTRGWRARWLPFKGASNDGVVGLEETRLHGVPAVEVNAVHTFLMNRNDVYQMVDGFLDQGVEAEPVKARLPVAEDGAEPLG